MPLQVGAEATENITLSLADKLRVEWLKSLGKRAQWTAFWSEIGNTMSDDVEITCYALQSRRQREGDAALASARPLWFTGATLPDACTPLRDWPPPFDSPAAFSTSTHRRGRAIR